MKSYKIELGDETADFYERVAQGAGLQMERVLSDTLFRMAGELAIRAAASPQMSVDNDDQRRYNK